MHVAPSKSFKAVLERMQSRLNWIIVHVPFDVAKVWKTRGMVRVKGGINGFGFRTSLFPTGKGGHYLMINKRMQAGGRARPGSLAEFHIELDKEEREAKVPVELGRVLKEEKALRRWYGQLNYSTRKAIGDWVEEVKSGEARQRRAEQIAERLMATMEAERDLPPVLKVAFARQAGASEGWERMSLSRRRGHLMGIFYYRAPESRARRVAKAVEDAVQFAEKKRGRG